MDLIEDLPEPDLPCGVASVGGSWRWRSGGGVAEEGEGEGTYHEEDFLLPTFSFLHRYVRFAGWMWRLLSEWVGVGVGLG